MFRNRRIIFMIFKQACLSAYAIDFQLLNHFRRNLVTSRCSGGVTS